MDIPSSDHFEQLIEEHSDELKSKHKALPSDFDTAAEASHFANLFREELVIPLHDFDHLAVAGVGGSATVFRAHSQSKGVDQALKLPRSATYRQLLADTTSLDIEPERLALEKVHHENITRLFDSFPLAGGKAYAFLTEFVEDPQDLDEYAEALCCTDECRSNDDVMEFNLIRVARAVYGFSRALQYMHNVTELLHFDVKPGNCIVARFKPHSIGRSRLHIPTSEPIHRPFLTDFGFARDATRYADKDPVKVGFTAKYAHPRLSRGALASRTPARSSKPILGEDLTPAIDLFAFGRTLQELLSRLKSENGERIASFYFYKYLHLVACLCLDGENATGEPASTSTFVSDQALGLPIDVFAVHKFTNFSQVVESLERLLSIRVVESFVPELNPWSKASITAASSGVTPFTTRVRAIVEHPLFSRLASTPQLGMLETVYPTATHTRFEHAIGTYHWASQYLAALYNDPENPTFKVLVTEQHLRAALVAALTHDLGQTVFGHELEEVSPQFGHAAITGLLLRGSQPKDRFGRSVKDIVELEQPKGWGLTISNVSRLLVKGESREPIEQCLFDIIDSWVDADKLDYLTRDSRATRVHYGEGIDAQKFLRSLTTAGGQQRGRSSIRLAIKQKGAPSAEALALARYEMYQAVYWHHTFRAIKAMVLTVAGHCVQTDRTALLNEASVVLSQFVDEVILNLGRPARGKRTAVGEDLWAKNNLGAYKYGNDSTIRFLWERSAGKDKELISDLVQRRYYKRAFEIPLEEESRQKLGEEMARGRDDIQQRVETKLLGLMRSALQGAEKERRTAAPADELERLEVIADTKQCFLVDLPLRGFKGWDGRGPKYIPDFKRKYFQAREEEEGQGVGRVWSQIVLPLMTQSVMFRVFCEPEVHRMLTTYVTPQQILTAVVDAVPSLSL